ncbi:hypothetical protein [Luteitalea pratensis]|nr:hypothetical protein [Luteitalea pratensis]
MPNNWRRRHWLLLAATMAAAVPVAFGCIRAVTTGDDVRYLWMAGAAILGSMVFVPRRRSAARTPNVLLRGLSAVACGVVCAAAMAVLQGARSVPSVAIVALAFGLCTGTSAVFAMLAREARHQGMS